MKAGVKPIFVSTPGRIDFLNTHQDYKGLPVVPVAINLRCYALGYRNNSDIVNFASLNIIDHGFEGYDTFCLMDLKLRGEGWFGDYVRAIFKSFMDFAFDVGGMDIALWSEIPIGAGLSSSAALEVSIVKLVDEAYGLNLDKSMIAEIAYRAEHDIIGVPCGRLDQYGCSYGGIIVLDPNPPCKVEVLPCDDLLFIAADSGIHRRIINVHPIRQAEINDALRILLNEVAIDGSLRSKLAYNYYEVSWRNISENEIKPYLPSLPKNLANRLLFTIRMNISTIYAIDLIRGLKPHVDEIKSLLGDDFVSKYNVDFNDKLSVIGLIINYQHELLRDYYEVSLPILEDIRNIMLDNGALGAKISGAGLGGVVVGLIRDKGVAERVRKACVDYGCPLSFYSNPSEGVKTEYLSLDD
ncbi:MAG: galactokinase family protein [Candidatus Methanomethylicia archaeon]